MSEDFNMTRLSELRKKEHELNEQLIELNNQQYQLTYQHMRLKRGSNPLFFIRKI